MQLTIDGYLPDAAPTLTEWQQVELAYLPPEGVLLALRVAGTTLEPFLRPGDPAVRWRWNPQNGVGLFDFELTAQQPGMPPERQVLRLRVVPRKIDQQHYTALLAEVQQVARSLAYSLGAGGEGTAGRDEGEALQIEQVYALLESGVDRAAQALTQIARRPHEQLRQVPHSQSLDATDGRDPQTPLWLAQGDLVPAPPEMLPELQRQLRPAGGLLPHMLPSRRSDPSLDTYENRLLKHLLGQIARQLRQCAQALRREQTRLDRNSGYVEAERGKAAAVEALLGRCTASIARMQALRAVSFLETVGPLQQYLGPSSTTQRDPRYREVYRLWQDSRRAPTLNPASDLLALPIHELPRLYEVWCVLRVAQELLTLPGVELASQALLAPADEGLGLSLALPAELPLLVLRCGAALLTLRYQPRYRPLAGGSNQALGSLDRHTRVPDIAIEAERPGKQVAVWLLDAKYRLDAGGGVPQQALDDAYAYLGSIGRPDGSRAATGALLLYPGQGPAERYASGVGSLPLLPGSPAEGLRTLLHELIAAHSTP